MSKKKRGGFISKLFGLGHDKKSSETAETQFINTDIRSDETDTDFKQRNVLVGVLKNTSQLSSMFHYKFYHIPMSRVSECQFPVKYVAVYQSKKLFGSDAGIRYYGTVESCKTVPRRKIHEIPKNSDEKYLYFKIKKWYKLDRKAIEAKEMNGVAFSTTVFLLKNAKDSIELQLRSREEYDFYRELVKTVRRLVLNNMPDHTDIVYRDYTVKLHGGLLYLYFADVLEYIIGFDVFLERPMDVIRDIFDYYPEV